MQIINLNKHAVNVIVGGEEVEFPPSGQVATVETKAALSPNVTTEDGFVIPTVYTSYGEVKGLPEPIEGVLYLVNMLVGQRAALEGRTDLIGPDSGPSAIRYIDGPQKGQIEAVTQFVRY